MEPNKAANPAKRRNFLSVAKKLLASYLKGRGYPTHSEFMAALLSPYIDDDFAIIQQGNEKLEQLTAKRLVVVYWTDGQQIILEYAYNKVEDKLEYLTEEDYQDYVDSGKYDIARGKYILEGWIVMAEAMYDVFIEPERSADFEIDPSKTNQAIYQSNFGMNNKEEKK